MDTPESSYPGILPFLDAMQKRLIALEKLVKHYTEMHNAMITDLSQNVQHMDDFLAAQFPEAE